MGRLGLLVAAALIAGGFSMQQAYAQSDNTSTQKTEKADKKKSTEKKNNTATQSGAQNNSGKSAPMSGYRPDTESNY